jgi:L-alanine-DL-glutamate epimerase-like enolase superfamily enzyme
MLENNLLTEDLPIHGGMLTVPTGTGLGVHLDRQALAKYTLARQNHEYI